MRSVCLPQPELEEQGAEAPHDLLFLEAADIEEMVGAGGGGFATLQAAIARIERHEQQAEHQLPPPPPPVGAEGDTAPAKQHSQAAVPTPLPEAGARTAAATASVDRRGVDMHRHGGERKKSPRAAAALGNSWWDTLGPQHPSYTAGMLSPEVSRLPQ
eukprot:SAG22_NODE_1798_length_3548_cov_39.134532_3_plen_158_part_00